MHPGKILLEWGADGQLAIKCSLPMTSAEAKKTAVRVLLDAAKAVNDSGTPLLAPAAAPARILANGAW